MKHSIKKTVSIILSVTVILLTPIYSLGLTVLRGDADLNGKTDVADARLALRYAVGLEFVTDGALRICDIDGNGRIDVGDARAILRHAVGLELITGDPLEISEDELEPPAEEDILGDLSAYPLPEEPKYEKKPGYFTFVVYGDGHGIGLSQYGAVYMAEKGCSFQYILSHYFPGSILIKGEQPPEKSVYVGREYDTVELLCRMVAQEIGGIQPPIESLKAQTVAIYTLLKKYNFNVSGKWDVATICDTSSWVWTNDWTKDILIPTVTSLVGQYLIRENDLQKQPILSVYSRMAAGATVNCADEWYASYPVSVKSPFEMTRGDFAKVYSYSVSEMKSKLLKLVDADELGSDPSTWLKILAHTASIDENRGYVTDILVGETVFSSVGNFSGRMGFRSGCFTVEYIKQR